MLIGETDIQKFGAKQLLVEISPPQTAVAKEWIAGAVVPVEENTFTAFSHIKITVFFRGKTRNDITLAISDMNAILQTAVDLTLDGYARKFHGYMTANDETKTSQKNRYIATFEFDGYWYGEEITLTANGKNALEFEAKGNRPAPVQIIIIPNESVSELTIHGFDEPMIIKNLPRAATIIIDGELGIITQDGATKWSDFDCWGFPFVRVGKDKAHKINIVNGEKCAITLKYRPMYL